MAYQYPGTSQPQPVFPIRRANIPSIHSHSARNGMTRKSNHSDDSENRLPEDVYAQVIEESNQWAKAEDAGLVYRWNGKGCRHVGPGPGNDVGRCHHRRGCR